MTKAPQNLQEIFEKMQREGAERRRRAQEEWAKLAPEERLAKQEALRRAQEHRQKQEAAAQAARARRAVEKAAAPYRQHASFTLLDFACLLHGYRPPGAVDRWAGVGPHEDDAAVVNTRRVLGSTVRHTPAPIPDLPLYPVNPAAAEKEHRFPRDVLLECAREKGLGHAAILADVLGGPRPTAATPKPASAVAAAPAAKVTPAPVVAAAPAVSRAPMKRPWQRQADALMADVIAALRGRAEGERRPYEAVRAEFGRRCSVKALHEELKLGRGVPKGEEPHGIGLDSFRRYLLAHHRGFEFAGGRPTGDRDFLKALLED